MNTDEDLRFTDKHRFKMNTDEGRDSPALWGPCEGCREWTVPSTLGTGSETRLTVLFH